MTFRRITRVPPDMAFGTAKTNELSSYSVSMRRYGGASRLARAGRVQSVNGAAQVIGFDDEEAFVVDVQRKKKLISEAMGFLLLAGLAVYALSKLDK